MSIEIIPYSQEYESEWDQFCAGAINATFLHTRRFLNYHGDKFKDMSVLILNTGKVVGIFPAAESVSDANMVISHPGITYGGVVHNGWLSGMRMVEALFALSEYYASNEYNRLQYKAVPYIYTTIPAQDDKYALFCLGARRTRCDLSSTIELTNRQPLSNRRKRGLKKAKKVTTLSSDSARLEGLWEVIEKNLALKHDAKPVHSLAEITLLRERFPNQILIRCALLDGCVEAGVIFFNSPNVWHAQYIAASESAYRVSALDAVFDSSISEAQQAGAHYFDFGTSNKDDGKIINDGLYRFKSEFGGGGVAHEFWEIDLEK